MTLKKGRQKSVNTIVRGSNILVRGAERKVIEKNGCLVVSASSTRKGMTACSKPKK